MIQRRHLETAYVCLLCMYFTRGKLLREARATVTLRSRRLLLEIVERGQNRRLRDGRAEAIADLALDEVTVPQAHEHFLWRSSLFAPPGELCRVFLPRHVPTARRLDVAVHDKNSARIRLDRMRERTREELVEVALQRRVLRRALLEFRQPSAVALAENTAPPNTDAARNLCLYGPLPFDYLESRISPEDNERVLGFSKFVRQLLDPFGVGSNSITVNDEAHPVLATQETDGVVCLNRGFERESREISIALVRVFRDA